MTLALSLTCFQIASKLNIESLSYKVINYMIKRYLMCIRQCVGEKRKHLKVTHLEQVLCIILQHLYTFLKCFLNYIFLFGTGKRAVNFNIFFQTSAQEEPTSATMGLIALY